MIHTEKIDDDADVQLLNFVTQVLTSKVPALRQRIVSITAVQFDPATRGYYVITDDTQEAK